VTQNAINLLESSAKRGDGAPNVWNAPSLFDVATMLGDCLREVKRRDAAYLTQNNIDANANFILGGQVKGEHQRLFMLYQEGNFIEATPDTPFFQVGETKYGKPIIDRVVKRSTSVIDATKCVLISFDSTMRSNVSVGLPIDLVTYPRDSLRIQIQRRITETDPYFTMIHHQWGEGLRRVFAQLPDPYWEDAAG
jgi:putative proteasome-type protease